jgi:Cu/Ag efflux pump CusA
MCVVTGRLDNKDLGTVMQNIKKISSTVILPSGYYIDYGGAYKDQQQSFKELLLILMASCLLVFVFYYFYFEI